MKFDTDDDLTDLEDDIVIPLLSDSESITCDDLSSGDNGNSNDTEDGEDDDDTTKIVLTESRSYLKKEIVLMQLIVNGFAVIMIMIMDVNLRMIPVQ